MKSFTIHKVDARTAAALEERSRREGTSMNRLVKRLLRGALGLEEPERVSHRSEFEDLFGTWSKEEGDAFDEAVDDFAQVNEADWEE